jgi:hypothetical protein
MLRISLFGPPNRRIQPERYVQYSPKNLLKNARCIQYQTVKLFIENIKMIDPEFPVSFPTTSKALAPGRLRHLQMVEFGVNCAVFQLCPYTWQDHRLIVVGFIPTTIHVTHYAVNGFMLPIRVKFTVNMQNLRIYQQNHGGLGC